MEQVIPPVTNLWPTTRVQSTDGNRWISPIKEEGDAIPTHKTRRGDRARNRGAKTHCFITKDKIGDRKKEKTEKLVEIVPGIS